MVRAQLARCKPDTLTEIEERVADSMDAAFPQGGGGGGACAQLDADRRLQVPFCSLFRFYAVQHAVTAALPHVERKGLHQGLQAPPTPL